MKVLSTAAVLLAGSTCSAFAPSASRAAVCRANNCPTSLNMALPFFAQEQEKAEEEPAAPAAAAAKEEIDLNSLTLEEEIDFLTEKELEKNKRISNLRSESGVEFAPWMGKSGEAENLIRMTVKERVTGRRSQKARDSLTSGNLLKDSQAQELSGTGLSYKIIDGEVELEWATKTESGTSGFVIRRRAAKTEEYSVIASYKDWGPLQSKGPDGGVYRFLDNTASPGGWVYRISEEDQDGNSADICQCLVEVQTEDEQKAALVAGVGFAVFSVLVLVAGIAADPMNGY